MDLLTRSFPILHLLQDCEDPPNTRETVERVQCALRIQFPEDYKEFLLQFNGGTFSHWLEFGLPFPQRFLSGSIVNSFWGLEDGKIDSLVDYTRYCSRFTRARCVPLSYTQTGDYVLLRFARWKFDGVWFWDRSADPDRGERKLHPVADSFAEFLSMLRVMEFGNGEERETVPVFQAVERGALTSIQRYLSEGGNPNRRNAKGQTLLAAAAIYRWPQIVRLLLEHSAEPNARDRKGRTPLHHAAQRSVDSVKLLIAAGADVKARDNKGKSTISNWYWRADEVLRAHGATE